MNKQKVLVLGCGNAGLGKAISAMLAATDAMMVLGGVVERTTYEIKLIPPMPTNIVLMLNKPDGHYRQFEKRDKRKNFR